ncbi:MAG: adenylate/guanylate cyclase domain-containing protein [Pseudomonadota bacterium]
MTVMFCDLVGSTALSAQLDPEDMRDVIRGYQDACSGVITRFDGLVAKYMGDGVLAYFGYPRAHEDDPERAVRSALAVVEAVAKLPRPTETALAARVGIATGLVVVGDLVGSGAAQEQAVVGDTPNLAARLQGVAEPGRVVIGEATRRLLGEHFELVDLGPQNLKGIATTGAFQVVGEQRIESRFEARTGPSLPPMVGRDHELALLLERWGQAKAGEGQGVLLVGEAGIGKSRVLRALLDSLAAEPHIRIRYQCSPYHADSALWPVTQQLTHAAGFASSDSPEAMLDKLEGLLRQSGGDMRDAVLLLGDLLGLDATTRHGTLDLTPPAQRTRMLAALVNQLLGLARSGPVLVVLEDAHWIDPTTLEMIGQALDVIAEARVLIVLTSRPDRQPELAGHPHMTRLTLNRLGRGGAEAIVARLSGGRSLPSDVIDAILVRTDGVPLFVEELTKTILEIGETSVPASLHDSLMARLDRVPEVKDVAQTAACIGREFSYRLLAAVAGKESEPDVRGALEKLAAAEIVFRRGVPPEARYTFKHALVQDAAYQSLLKSRRQQLHATIADTLERGFHEIVESEPEVLARHHTAAGHAERGARYWERAGARATAQSAFVEAIHHYGGGLDQLGSLADGPVRDRLELSLQMGLGDALSWIRGFAAPEVEAAYNRAHELSSRIGETAEQFQILWVLWHFFTIRADLSRAEELSQEVAKLGRRLEDPAFAPHVRRTLSETNLWRGDFASARREAAAGLEGAGTPEPKTIPGVQDPRVMCGLWQSTALWHLGYPAQSVACMDAAVELARNSALSGDLGAALIFAVWLRLWRREERTAHALAERAHRYNAEHGLAFHVAVADILIGSIAVSEARDPSGIARIRGGTAQIKATGAGIFLPSALCMLAAAHGALGERTEGLAILAECQDLISRSGERWGEAEVHGMRGRLLYAGGGAEPEAEAAFRSAIGVALAQEARSPALRAATGLALLLRDQGRQAEARELLAPIHGWFTEGLDTPDLKDAGALLNHLG